MSIYDEARLIKMYYDCFRDTPDEYNLSFFLRFFPKNYYGILKTEHKVNIETCVLQGIANGRLNYMTGKVTGEYSVAVTWAAEFMEQFAQKEQIIEAVRRHAIKSPLSQNYAIWFFHDYVRLDREENLNYYKNVFFNKKILCATEYSLLNTFIDSKSDLAYKIFCEQIKRYEKAKNIDEAGKIPFDK